eukprot:5345052-Alexandrium_andersonii.AAC.1
MAAARLVSGAQTASIGHCVSSAPKEPQPRDHSALRNFQQIQATLSRAQSCLKLPMAAHSCSKLLEA